ncbi:hypothetical protein [Kordia sp.]|uniref:hypothetical protein n=1 Tax=Kordia sp. TaxID=1965332 RepID=UPI003D28655C
MLNSILKINGIKELSKTQQQNTLGGFIGNCSGYNGPVCFGPVQGCGSCAHYNSLPIEYQACALVHVSCEEFDPL